MKSIKSLLEASNPWWSSKETFPYVPSYERSLLSDLLRLDIAHATILIGPRQSGKTTLMLQAIKHLLGKVSQSKVVYAPMDQIKEASIKDIISAHQELTAAGSGSYYFFDEVHYDKSWSTALKTLIDARNGNRYCATGSSSTLLLKNVSESGLGRFVFKPISPMSFGEYAEASGKKPVFDLNLNSLNLEDGLKLATESRELEPLFQKYLLWGGFPAQFSSAFDLQSWHNNLRQNYVSLAIYKDIISQYEIRDPAVLEDILYLVSEKTSLPLSYESIAKSFHLTIATVRSYLNYLESAGLIISCEYYTKNTLKKAHRNKKFYISDPGFNTALSYSMTMSDNLASKNVETAVAACISNAIKKSTGLLQSRTAYWKEKYEVDFVVRGAEGIMPLEVKYTDDIEEKDLRGLTDFMEKYRLKRGIVITKNLAEKDRTGSIIFMPARIFLSGMR